MASISPGSAEHLAESESWSVSISSKRAVDTLVIVGVSSFAIQGENINLLKTGVIIRANTSKHILCAKHHYKVFLSHTYLVNSYCNTLR